MDSNRKSNWNLSSCVRFSGAKTAPVPKHYADLNYPWRRNNYSPRAEWKNHVSYPLLVTAGSAIKRYIIIRLKSKIESFNLELCSIFRANYMVVQRCLWAPISPVTTINYSSRYLLCESILLYPELMQPKAHIVCVLLARLLLSK